LTKYTNVSKSAIKFSKSGIGEAVRMEIGETKELSKEILEVKSQAIDELVKTGYLVKGEVKEKKEENKSVIEEKEKLDDKKEIVIETKKEIFGKTKNKKK